ncbi:hypothetical protein [Lysinibacter sp. HNR]|uniref:O-antigen ligase family protein n=1 Tax=Lysinibacter sp. HNR TaxID=3031408 RepID=UPI0024353852|nr:hypothetical protein [Lysinibacter sp. HNR]WGD38099.1 hypothetical protein FrondiHNR_04045 [Lysinibacter sp. HNR]
MQTLLQQLFEFARRFLSSAEFAAVLTTAIFGVLFAAHFIQRIMGGPAYTAMILTLVILAVLSAIFRRGELSWGEKLPLTLTIFILWCCITLMWSSRPSATWSSLLYQVGVALLGLYIASYRDHIQIIRALGNTLRVLLTASLGVELLSGILLDIPFSLLRVEGNLAYGGPIQGIFGSRNALAFVAVISLVTTVIELKTRAIQRSLAIYSFILAGSLLLFSRSVIQAGVILCVALVFGAVLLIRRRNASERTRWQIGFFALVAVFTIFSWLLRNEIVARLHATSELKVRLTLWQSVLTSARQSPLEGWGWVGIWPSGAQPYFAINFDIGTKHQSALGTFFDLYLQVGMVGLILFIAALLLAFIRSFLTATTKRSDVYLWPILIITTLAITGLAESNLLTGSGWLLVVIGVALASQNMSWRTRLRPLPDSTP